MIATSNKLIVMLFQEASEIFQPISKMQASVFEISIFPLVLQIPVSQHIHIGGECVHVYAQNIESDLLAEDVSGDGGKGERKRRNVRASRHRRTLRLHPISRFYSLIPLCSPPFPPGSQGDFYSSLRISTLTSRHPQPSPSPRTHLPSLPHPLLSPRFRAIPYSLIFPFSLSLFPCLLQLPSGSSLQVVAAIPSPGPLLVRPSSVLFPLRHPLRDSHEST